MAHGGAPPRLLLLSRTEEEKRERSGGDRMARWGMGCRPDRGKPVGRGASTTPAYGRHVAGAEWSEAGAARGREGRGNWDTLPGWAEREAGWPSCACPLSLFFEIIFLKSLNETFEAFTNLFRGSSKKKNCSP